MNALLSLAARSAWNRRFVLSLTVFSIALSTFLLVGIEQLRTGARASFSRSVSGTDLVVGARSNSVQLLLHAVFRIGEPTQGMRWASVEKLAANPLVAWVVPLSLGDSHRGFPVLGTTSGYFTHFRYGYREALAFSDGRPFDRLFDAVLGAEVASRLGYRTGDRITLSHGTGGVGFAEHGDKPFTVSGVLAPTGTPVDRSVHVSLEAIEALHLDWQGGAPIPGLSIPPEFVRKFDLQPRSVTALLVGLHSRASVFAMQRQIAEFRPEPLSAVLPGVALDQLWELVGAGESALLAISALVSVVSLAGLVAVVLAGLNERRRELAILRALGASPRHVLFLLAMEGAIVILAGLLAGLAALVAGLAAGAPMLRAELGIDLPFVAPTGNQILLAAGILAAGFCASLVPALRAYRLSLADGLTPRI